MIIVTRKKILFIQCVRRGHQFKYVKINEKINIAKFPQLPCSSPSQLNLCFVEQSFGSL